ncbi:RNA polymerase I-specific transcription initiation factor RRN3 [Pluteus cervinus]|uniref:RNA polymerase I-specific transcription initiation factor RRN3 n=1 Tax=Pluteus cervinus TaxID=181527 RepID=A0ACD3AEM9_9AGAR|nr:RNA polymerase I-specific transcription initiation factor RRN3 [Pluteus cervinus]
MDPLSSKPPLDNFPKRPPNAPQTRKNGSSGPSSSLIRRPIATNSRIKQEQKTQKDMYLIYVNNALQQKTQGNTQPFDDLVNRLNVRQITQEMAPQLAEIRFWLSALSHVVSRLERTHSVLVEAVINMPWTVLDTATVKSYTVFIGMLLSARPEYLSLVLGRIAQGFTHQSGMQAVNSGLPESSSAPLTRRVVYERIHFLLRHLLSLIPTLPSTLQPLIVRNFPHKRQNQAAQTTYIRNLLRVSSYCPELTDRILATIIDRAVQIDVEIQVEIDELEEDPADDQAVFELDPFDTLVGQDEPEDQDSEDEDDFDDNFSDLSSDGEDMEDEAKAPELPTNVKHIRDMVKKLDAIMTLVFDHFHRTQTSICPSSSVSSSQSLTELPPLPPMSLDDSSPLPTPIDSSQDCAPSRGVNDISKSPSQLDADKKALLRMQFHTLLSIFDRTILPTFKSRYTQFLLFWYTSLDPEFSDIFQGMLVDRALFQSGPDSARNELTHEGRDVHCVTPAVTRAAAASYIGSFVSRATFVDREGTRRVVAVLCEYLRAHLDGIEEILRTEEDAGALGGPQNDVFYAVVQSLFLIFCFRWRDLMDEEEEDGKRIWMPELNMMQRVVTSVLNPLKVCSSNVVMQFARVAHTTAFLYCYSILESNKRSEYSTPSGANNFDGASTIHPALLNMVHPELTTFFPFDPYRLPKSNVYIQGVYREWSSVAIDEEEEDSDDGDSDKDDDDSSIGAEESSGDEPPETVSGSGFLPIPRPGGEKDDNGLGQSLGAMSITPSSVGV